MTYIPIYAALWLAFLIPFRAQRRVVLWRWVHIAFALFVLGIDRSAVLSGRDRHDVGTRRHFAADVPSGLAASVAGLLAGASYPFFRFARTTCN